MRETHTRWFEDKIWMMVTKLLESAAKTALHEILHPNK